MDEPLSCLLRCARQLVFSNTNQRKMRMRAFPDRLRSAGSTTKRCAMLRMFCALISIVGAQLGWAAQTNEFNIATYNLRLNVASDGPNAWPQRRDAVKALIRYHEFDILGTQEGLIDQIEDLAAMPGFAYVGVGRDDGVHGGEHSAIFFRKARFEVEAHGDFWLSQTPERPSKGWDAVCCNRIATWARFRDRTSAKRFFVFNVHFDHQGEEARRQSAVLMLRKIQQIAGAATVICTGYFNSTPDTEQIKTLRTVFRDAREVSAEPPYGPVGTFNDFKLDAAMTERIDYIFVGPRITVFKYAVLSDSVDRRYPSDHHPVVARLQIQ
jgi:endonuclease/exonuclease/phosphatase family metal-dependent hydrolase